MSTLITGYAAFRTWLNRAPNSYERFTAGLTRTPDDQADIKLETDVNVVEELANGELGVITTAVQLAVR